MQPRECLVHRIEVPRPRLTLDLRQGRVPENASFHVVHHVEPRSYDVLIGAQSVHMRNGIADRSETLQNARLPLDRVRTLEQDARGLAAQDKRSVGSNQLIGRIRLSAPELLHGQRTRETRYR